VNTTADKLIAAAAALLDAGGEDAVTFRAVGQAAGLSHNTPFKLFKSRGALLAAVALDDLAMLTGKLEALRDTIMPSRDKLMAAAAVIVDYSRAKPARYRLMFNDPSVMEDGDALRQQALKTFAVFTTMVREFRGASQPGDVPAEQLAGLLSATLHGAISLETSGRMSADKGISGVLPAMALMVELIAPRPPVR
jgi:AcrR family transcriptional regulator